MALSNNLKKQVDIPVWEWCRFSPAVSSAVSATCTADNSLYHVSFGRYIYYLQAAATLASTTALTGFFRYDTISDSYQLLAQPPIAPVVYTGLQFAGGQGYFGNVLGNGGGLNTLQIPAMTGQTFKGFDIRIIGGTGIGQQRVITKVSDPTIWDNGTATSVAATPQGNITDSNKNWVMNQWAGYQVRLVSSSGQSQARKILYNNSNTLYFADVAKFAEDPWAWSPITTITGSALVIASATAGSQTMYQIESSVITVDSNWATVPDASSRFVIRGGGIWMISQGTTYTLQYYDVLGDQWYIRNAGAATSPVTAIGTDGTIVNTGENATVWERGVATGSQTTTTLQDTSKSWTTNQWAGYNVRIFSGTGENQYRVITSNTSNTLTVPTWTSITPDTTTRYFIESFDMGTVSSAGAITQTGASTGSINGSVFTAGTTTGVYYPGQILSGTGVQSTVSILSPVAACYTTGLSTTINFASGNPTTLGITVGMVVSINSIVGLPSQAGTGVLASGNPTFVTAVGSSTVTINIAVATALLNATLQFSTAWVSALAAHTNNGNQITLTGGSTTTNLYPGMYISVGAGTGTIPVGTYVAQVIDSTRFTLSQTPTVALSGSVWLLGQGYQTVITNQLTGLPGGAGTYNVFPSQQVSSTTITGTGVQTITDSTKSWPRDRWNNYAVRIRSGTGMGQVRQILDTVSDGTVAYTSATGATNVGSTITVTSTTNLAVNQILNVIAGTGSFAYGTYVQSITNSTTFIASAAPTIDLSASAQITGTPINTLKVYPAWTTTPDNTSVYAIHGDTDKNYFSTAAQTPSFIHNIEADLPTTGRLLDRGVARGISAQYSDYEPVAISSGVPVLTINGGYGFITGVATTAATSSSNIATLTLTTAASSGIFAVGSWITVAGVTPTSYNGTWQVTASSIGSVSFYSTTASGAQTIAGTVAQAASVSFNVGAITGGAWTQFGAATTLTLTGCVPSTFNGTLTVSCGTSGTTGSTFGGYQSAVGATSSGTTITVGSTVGVVVGAIPTITAGTGTFATGTVVTSITDSTRFVVNNAPSVALSGGATVVTIVPSVAFTSSSPVGSLVTYGVAQKTPQASTSITGSGSTVTIATSNTVFPVGSWITVTGAAPGTYNGIYQVTGGTPGTNVTYANTTTVTATTQALVGIATNTQLVTTVNNTNLQTGLVVTHRGDQGYSASTNNVAAAITIMTPAVGTPATQYTYSVASPAAAMFVYGQTTTTLSDATKNWVPNQWAGAQVTYNSTQITGVAAPVQPTILTAYIIANTSNTLIFSAAHTTAPSQGISKYVITAPATFTCGNTLGSQDSGLVQGAQLITQLQDVTKSWIMPAPVTGITGTTITVGAATVVITGSMSNILPGMTVAITLGGVTLPSGTTVSSISGTTVTMSNVFGGSGTTATFSFAATASSSGNVVTVTGYPLVNLAPGMRLAVTSTTNMSPSVLSTGAFVLNGGVNFTPVTVVSITSATTFTISTTPTVPLVNATVQATFWVPSQWVGRRIRITSGITINNVEAIVTANTSNTLTFLTIGTAPVHGTNGYAILQQPVRGLGTALLWNFGASNLSTIGKYLYQARGGSLPGFDRLNITTDKWEFMTATPSYEVLATGAMYAYDGADRIYFTVQVTQRVYYLDIENNVIHPAGMYPYTAGTATVGNRMEIFTTADGLKYLWLNRHSNVECFKQLLFY